MNKYVLLLIGCVMMQGAIIAQTYKTDSSAKGSNVVKDKYDYRANYKDSYTPTINVQKSQKNNATINSTPNVKPVPQYNGSSSYKASQQQNTDYSRAGTHSNMNNGANRDQSYYRNK